MWYKSNIQKNIVHKKINLRKASMINYQQDNRWKDTLCSLGTTFHTHLWVHNQTSSFNLSQRLFHWTYSHLVHSFGAFTRQRKAWGILWINNSSPSPTVPHNVQYLHLPKMTVDTGKKETSNCQSYESDVSLNCWHNLNN